MLLEHKKRYSRQLALPLIGIEGQEILLASRVLVVGIGGLGSPLALYLAAAGVGTIGLIDSDTVDISNLNRQILFSGSDIGSDKTTCAARTLTSLNPDINIIPHQVRLTEKNIAGIFSSYDIIADASDNFSTRFLVNHYCVTASKTLVWGAVQEFKGQISTVKPHADPDFACFACFCPKAPVDPMMPNCSVNGILGSIAGTIATLQATEVIKELLHIGETLAGKILMYDGLHATFRKPTLKQNPSCSICHAKESYNATV